MFGKIFESIYDGTLVADWRALVTFQQLIVLSDSNGIVDMTPHAIAARTGIPIEHIEAGLKILENPDPYSRTPDNEGRRIDLIDDHRPWGWTIVNHTMYKELISREDKKNKDRERIAKKRENKLARLEAKKALQANENAGVAGCRNLSQSVANVAYEDEDEDEVKNSSDSQANTSTVSAKITKKQQESIIELYHEMLPELSTVLVNRWHGSKHATALANRWKEDPQFRSKTFWTKFFNTVRQNSWWMGLPDPVSQQSWKKCNLAWLVNRTNFDKVMQLGNDLSREL